VIARMLPQTAFFLAAVAVGAQAPPAFEAASVKIRPGSSGLTDISPYGTGRFTASNAPLDLIIQIAFGVGSNRLEGGPGWLKVERYDVVAKAEEGVLLTPEHLRPRLQALLEQRFKLATHRQTRLVDGYALVPAKGGPKLKPAVGELKPGGIYPGGMRFDNISVAGFAGWLSYPVGRPVVDQTGLAGNYDVIVEYARDGSTDSPLPSIFTALQEQLGLKLEPLKQVPVEMLVVDHVERVPTEN
jgi:uncharacterized protein (TIGR03435 family)